MREDAGLPPVTPHELRHSTIRMTADLYTHIVGPQLREAMERTDEALG
ncbi:MAG: hypothetical protein ACRDYA_20520 [Egibacteraceae bacterium]